VASQHIITRIFESDNDTILEDILADQMHGIAFIQKLLSCPLVASDPALKAELVDKVKAGLARVHVDQAPAFVRMMSEMGNGGSPAPHGQGMDRMERSPSQPPQSWTPPQAQYFHRGHSPNPPPRGGFNPWPGSPAMRHDGRGPFVHPGAYGSPSASPGPPLQPLFGTPNSFGTPSNFGTPPGMPYYGSPHPQQHYGTPPTGYYPQYDRPQYHPANFAQPAQQQQQQHM
jgi:hypothetical protein